MYDVFLKKCFCEVVMKLLFLHWFDNFGSLATLENFKVSGFCFAYLTFLGLDSEEQKRGQGQQTTLSGGLPHFPQ